MANGLLHRHAPFYLASLFGLAGLAVGWWTGTDITLVIASNAFFAVYIATTLPTLKSLTPQYLRKYAASSDAPVWLIFIVTISAVVAAMISLFLLINNKRTPEPVHLFVGLMAVPLGWFTIHLMAAIHYAHLYWQPETSDKDARRGLDFPGTKDPIGIDFLYFSCVIGMTAQTSDTQITGRHIRFFSLVHGIVSFFFNAVILAAAVNLAVSLGD
ncbi:MAG: DUF1345 domain-containing protein [Rhizobiaceae bacterium]|nr:DUF1345 domain-containing protein [Rhizobiaceae bacterium]